MLFKSIGNFEDDIEDKENQATELFKQAESLIDQLIEQSNKDEDQDVDMDGQGSDTKIREHILKNWKALLQRYKN